MYHFGYRYISFCFIVFALLGCDFSSAAHSPSIALGSIQAQFCNDGFITNDLNLVMRAGQQIPFCIQFTNAASTGVNLNIDFLDSIVTDDAFKHRACNAADRPKVVFGNYVLPYEKSLYLPGNTHLQKRYAISFPVGFNGISHGCLAYNVLGEQKTLQGENTQFSVVVRNVKFLDIYVGETSVDTSLHLASSPSLFEEGLSHYALAIPLINEGNVPQRLSISGTLDNFFGYTKHFYWSGIILAAKEKRIFSTKDFGAYYLPFYKGFFRVHVEVSHVPQFAFAIDAPTQPTKVTSPGITSFTRVIAIYNRQFFVSVFFALAFLALLYLAFFRKKKVLVMKMGSSPLV